MTVDVSLNDRHMALQEKTAGGALMEFFRAPRANYTIIGEAVRYIIPADLQCSMGCGGQTCKYDNPSYWRDDQQAIKGLYSSWVTDHLLAMSRPSTEIIEEYKIIDQFRRTGIKAVFNLQIPGEHASCGNPLEPESGFSYRPEVFMENNIYFYNFGWSDYGVANLSTMLDMVKVMAFALQEGKAAVHCHAGLGRTGVLLACFLAYSTRMTANQAILYVRAKRPGSVQTRGQLRCVRDFVKFLSPLRSVFSGAEPLSNRLTLAQHLNRQRHILHGCERKELRHLPKIVQLVSKLLVDIAENRQVIEEDILEAPDVQDIEMTLSIIEKLGPKLGPRLPGTPTLPRHFNEPAIFYHRKSLSYSESDLRRLGSELNLLTQPLGSASQDDVEMAAASQRWNRSLSEVSRGSSGSLWEKKNLVDPDGSVPFRTAKPQSIQRSESVGNDRLAARESTLSRWKAEQREELLVNGTNPESRNEEQSEKSEVPYITLQSELSQEARRLLVAQSLAVDLFLDGEQQHRNRVHGWQRELNLGGAWERLCVERDPFILTGLMWSWLEQLKEPAVSVEAAKALRPDDLHPLTALDTLDQAPRETLTCILDCMASMLLIPEEVEDAFLNRVIKAFTWVEPDSEEGGQVYETMTQALRCVLEKIRLTRIEEEENPLSPFALK